MSSATNSPKDSKPKNVLIIHVQKPEKSNHTYQIEWTRIDDFFGANFKSNFEKIDAEDSCAHYFDIDDVRVYMDDFARTKNLPENMLAMDFVYNVLWNNENQYLNQQLLGMYAQDTLVGGIMIYFEDNRKGAVLRRKFEQQVTKAIQQNPNVTMKTTAWNEKKKE